MVTRVGGWLPHPKKTRQWVNKKLAQAKANPVSVAPVIQDFWDAIIKDAQLFMLFTEMLDEVPSKYETDPSGRPEVRTIEDLMTVLNLIITEPPQWDSSAQIGTPINAVLDWPMGTKAGLAAFLNECDNMHLMKILKQWGNFLLTSNSCSTLNTETGGWFSEVALNSPHMKGFHDDFSADPSKPNWGFKSWDNFFTRDFKPGRRPVGSPDDDSVVVSAAEATPFAVQTSVSLHDKFWAKGQSYSLAHMMNNDPRAKQFVGGTVYQAFLSADSYHRWHAPVSGKIITDPVIVPGTYYSEPLATGFSPDEENDGPDPGADENSQGYISAVAARGIIFIQADNPLIGLMCIIMIGMAEVSSIEITMKTGQPFKKGEQLGMFHFGGSTHCLIFGPQVQLAFKFPKDLPGPNNSIQWPLSAPLATVSPANAM